MRLLALMVAVAVSGCGGDVVETDGGGRIGDPGPVVNGDVRCPETTSGPVEMLTLEGRPGEGALLAVDGWIYYIVREGARDVIRRVKSTETSSEEFVVDEPLSLPGMVSDGVDLFFTRRIAIEDAASSDAESFSTGLFARALTGGPVRTIVQQSPDGLAGVLGATPPRGVLWRYSRGDEVDIAHWDGTASTVITSMPRNDDGLLLDADARTIYWLRRIESTVAIVMATPLDGGPSGPLSGLLDGVFFFIGTDAANLYVTPYVPFPAPIRAFPKNGGAPLDLTEPTRTFDQGLVDGGWVYFVEVVLYHDGSYDHSKLERVRTSGGPRELVAHEPGTGIHALAADECSIYWIDENWSFSPSTSRLMRWSK
jgi:hypothetical protein